MNIALWIIQWLTAAGFLAAGSLKLFRSKTRIEATMIWAKEFSPAQIKLIGFAELLGAIGLVAPSLTGILAALTPIAALALFVLMIGAFYTHARLGELKKSSGAVALALLSLAVAVGRFFVIR